MGQDFFKRISKQEDRNKIIFDFVQSQSDLLTKIQNEIYKLKPIRIKSKTLICLPSDEQAKPIQEATEAIHSFFLGGEKYFFKGHVSEKNGTYEVTFDVDLFHLQRRQSYRIRIPESYNSHAKILVVNGKTTKVLEGKVQDLSAGGCAIELSSDITLSMNDQLHVEFWLKNKKSFETPVQIKYIGQPRQRGGGSKISYGVEFKPNEKFLEQKVFAITVELYRELYAKTA